MSHYEYTDEPGRTLSLTRSVANKGYVLLGIESENTEAFIHILEADVPTVAAELLKAAGQESVIVPKSTASFHEEEGVLLGGSVAEMSHHGAEYFLAKSADYAAAAEWLGSKAAREAAEKAEAEAAEKKLAERRDALAKELSICGYDYLGSAPILRKAIDRILTLEDKLASRD